MFNRSVERVMLILFMGIVGVAGLMVARLRFIDKGMLDPKVNLHESMRDYQIKKLATERMLVDNIYR